MTPNFRLKGAREILRLSRAQLAEIVGVTEDDIVKLEHGLARANAELKRRMALVLQRPESGLFDD